MSQFRRLISVSILLLPSGCFTLPPVSEVPGARPAGDAASCLEQLASEPRRTSQELDAGGFSAINWNIQKGKHADWADDLAAAHDDPDLLIMQEASPRFTAWKALAPTHFASFAEGFGLGDATTGVMTLSTVSPFTECRLVTREPWIGTRKATLVTEYALGETLQTLLVINVHGVNFTFGTQALARQLAEVQEIIAAHDGPVLLSGDFNTWRGARTEVLDKVAVTSGLTALEFDRDHRTLRFGLPLDHIYVRGLAPLHATTVALDSSDHNPMIVQLRVTERRIVLAEKP